MRKAMEYVKKARNLEAAIEMINSDTISRIYTWLVDLDDYSVFEVISSFNSNIHYMEDLDYEFDYMKPTEVLEVLSDIDTGDAYFNSDSKTSGDDVWDVADESIEDVAERIHDGEIETDSYEIENILDDEQCLIDEVTKRFKLYDQAKVLFDKMVAENPEEVLTILWNSQN